MDRTTVIVIAGPTASGKSALALDVAREFGGTVINADSMQVYRDLAILTARPDEAACGAIPHRLYGIMGAEQRCSAAEWRQMALEEIRAAHAADRLPLLTGGTGLYLKALVEGLSPMPDVPEEIRAAVRARLETQGAAALHRALAASDPDSAARIRPSDSQRIARALEVLEATGRPFSAWQAEAPVGPPAALRFRVIALMPPREALYAACDARFDAMLEQGALDEVKALLARDLDPSLPAMKALGVAELARTLDGSMSLDEAAELVRTATRRYAKRQLTWLRHQIVADFILEEQYSERFGPEIFAFIRENLLTV